MSKNAKKAPATGGGRLWLYTPGQVRGSGVREPDRPCYIVSRGSKLLPGIELAEVVSAEPDKFYWSAIAPVSSLRPAQ